MLRVFKCLTKMVSARGVSEEIRNNLKTGNYNTIRCMWNTWSGEPEDDPIEPMAVLLPTAIEEENKTKQLLII